MHHWLMLLSEKPWSSLVVVDARLPFVLVGCRDDSLGLAWPDHASRRGFGSDVGKEVQGPSEYDNFLVQWQLAFARTG